MKISSSDLIKDPNLRLSLVGETFVLNGKTTGIITENSGIIIAITTNEDIYWPFTIEFLDKNGNIKKCYLDSQLHYNIESVHDY